VFENGIKVGFKLVNGLDFKDILGCHLEVDVDTGNSGGIFFIVVVGVIDYEGGGAVAAANVKLVKLGNKGFGFVTFQGLQVVEDGQISLEQFLGECMFEAEFADLLVEFCFVILDLSLGGVGLGTSALMSWMLVTRPCHA